MNEFKLLPKVELHLHLDGSLNIESVSNRYNVKVEELNNKMVADSKCMNLNDYLTKFDYPISIMQTKEELSSSLIELLNTLKKQNVIYVEIRFAPQFHTKKGLTQDEVVKTLIDAKNKVDIKSNLILCFMRGSSYEVNHETLNVAKKYYNKGVCGVDLAGAEALYKTSEYKLLFDEVRELGMKFTIHAGEADGVESIRSAIDFGASRIGHGVRSIEDESILREIKDKNIYLEVCPTSNIQTCICTDYSNHPITKLYKYGIKTTINTDNMTVSNTTLENEYANLVNSTELTKNDIIEMNFNSINAAFISEEEKDELKSLLGGNYES